MVPESSTGGILTNMYSDVLHTHFSCTLAHDCKFYKPAVFGRSTDVVKYSTIHPFYHYPHPTKVFRFDSGSRIRDTSFIMNLKLGEICLGICSKNKFEAGWGLWSNVVRDFNHKSFHNLTVYTVGMTDKLCILW